MCTCTGEGGETIAREVGGKKRPLGRYTRCLSRGMRGRKAARAIGACHGARVEREYCLFIERGQKVCARGQFE